MIFKKINDTFENHDDAFSPLYIRNLQDKKQYIFTCILLFSRSAYCIYLKWHLIIAALCQKIGASRRYRG